MLGEYVSVGSMLPHLTVGDIVIKLRKPIVPTGCWRNPVSWMAYIFAAKNNAPIVRVAGLFPAAVFLPRSRRLELLASAGRAGLPYVRR